MVDITEVKDILQYFNYGNIDLYKKKNQKIYKNSIVILNITNGVV